MVQQFEVPMEEDEQISEQLIDHMVILFQIEDIEEVSDQIMKELDSMIQLYFAMKATQEPSDLLENMEKFIREAIMEFMVITHNIVLCHDAVMAMMGKDQARNETN